MTQAQYQAMRRYLAKVRALEKEYAKKYLKEARLLSSGGVPLSTIRGALNNPYGYGPTNWRGRPRGPIPFGSARFINKQSGQFYRGWVMKSLPGGGYQVVNTSTRVKYMMGTMHMVPRRIDLELKETVVADYNRAVTQLARGIKRDVWKILLA